MLPALIAALLSARAADVLVLAPAGPLAAREEGVVEVVVAEGGRVVAGRAPTVSIGSGPPLAPTGEPIPGHYRYAYTPPADGRSVEVVVTAEGAEPTGRTLPVTPPPPPVFTSSGDVEAVVGTPRIEVRFARGQAGRSDPSTLVARVSEGRVLEVRPDADGVVVAVEPGAERVARVMAVALADRDDPRGGVAFGLVKLRARPQLSLQAEPRSVVNVKVGKRSYGPFTADASGAAQVVFDALPGETSYEIQVSDDLGNTQRSTGPLPVSTRPVMVGVELTGRAGADLWLGGWSATGQAWTGAAPTCRTGTGELLEAATVGRSAWRLPVAREATRALFDPRVECALGEATIAVRVPLGADAPARVELQVYPAELSADFPIAQVQAALVDARGERMDASALRIEAARGELTLERTADAVRGDYRGAAAVESGGDRLVASWEQPPGSGRAWSLDAWPVVEAAELVVRARARDRLGRPLAGIPVRLTLGDLVRTADTDARGWASLRLPAVPTLPTVLELDGAGISRELAFIPGEVLTVPDPAAPDLASVVELPIRAGRVRQVFLDVEPRPLYTGSGGTGTVTVRMLDAAGQPVRDETPTIAASEGTVGPLEPTSGGAFRARYTPPPGMVQRTVRITAATSGASVATELALEPRPVSGGVGVSAGWISNLGTVSAPELSIAAWRHIPRLPKILAVRVGVSEYGITSAVRDPVAGTRITVETTFVPVDVGLMVLERWGSRSLHLGLAAVVTPYHMRGAFSGEVGVNGLTLASPGLVVQGGAGYRLGISELFVEARYLLFTAGSGPIVYDGSVGGGSISAGYRLLF